MPRALRGILQATSTSHGPHISVAIACALEGKNAFYDEFGTQKKENKKRHKTKQNTTKQTSYTVHM
jgi:hypothetical protein